MDGEFGRGCHRVGLAATGAEVARYGDDDRIREMFKRGPAAETNGKTARLRGKNFRIIMT